MIKKFFFKYKEIILYIIFGAGTTFVNIVVYFICSYLLKMGTVFSTVVAWILSVAFAYITNRIYVFQSKTRVIGKVIFEIISFVNARLITGVLDLLVMFLFVEILHCNDILIKVSSNVMVIILNYIASKKFIFRKGRNSQNEN